VELPGNLLGNLFRFYFGTKVVKDMKSTIMKEIHNGAWKASGKFENKEEENVYKQFLSVAYQATQGKLEDTTAGADHYVNLDLAKPNWSKVYPKTTKIGSHTYFKEKIIRK
jgi:spore germination cell wall hydrolase CwlJ-like protein